MQAKERKKWNDKSQLQMLVLKQNAPKIRDQVVNQIDSIIRLQRRKKGYVVKWIAHAKLNALIKRSFHRLEQRKSLKLQKFVRFFTVKRIQRMVRKAYHQSYDAVAQERIMRWAALKRYRELVCNLAFFGGNLVAVGKAANQASKMLGAFLIDTLSFL